MSFVRTIGAAISAVVLLGAGALAFVAADTREPPPAQSVPLASVHTVPAGVTRIVCAPAPVIAEGAVAYDSEFNPIPVTSSASLVAAAFPRDDDAGEASLALSVSAEPIELAGEAARIASGVPGPESAILLAEPVDGSAPLAAAGGVWRSDTGDLRSLTALPCSLAASDLWLLGGASEVGSSATLTLTNPGSTPVTATVTGWGPVGPVELPMLTGLVIAPHSAETYLLEASDATLERLALRVQTEGGAVGASLLDTRLDGFTPLGTDTVASGEPPAREQIITGIALTDPPEGTDLSNPAAQNLVRLLNPGESAATVTLTLLTADQELGISGAEALTLDPGAVFDVAIDGLPAGHHAVSVSSDQPVVAAAQVVRLAGGDGGAERAWTSATEASPVLTFAVPGIGSEVDAASLVLANASDSAVSAVVTPFSMEGAAGEPVEVTIPGRGTLTIPAGDLGTPAALRIEAETEVSGALLLETDGDAGDLVAILPATPDAAREHSVPVTVREN